MEQVHLPFWILSFFLLSLCLRCCGFLNTWPAISKFASMSFVPKMPAPKMSVRGGDLFESYVYTSLTQATVGVQKKKHLHVGKWVQWVTHLVRYNNNGKTNYIEIKLSQNLRCAKNFSCVYYFILFSIEIMRFGWMRVRDTSYRLSDMQSGCVLHKTIILFSKTISSTEINVARLPHEQI